MTKRKRCTYDAQFKKDAVALADEPKRNNSEVEKSLDIAYYLK